MAGLLGDSFFDDPLTQISMGLLGGTSPNFGQNVAQALQYAAMQRDAALKRKMLQQQMEVGGLDLQTKRQGAADDAAFRGALPGAPASTNADPYTYNMQMARYLADQSRMNPGLAKYAKQYFDEAQKLKPKYHVVDKALVPEPNDVGGASSPSYQAPLDEWKDEGRDKLTNQLIQRNTKTNAIHAIGTMPPQTNVSVNADKGYFGSVAEGLAKQDLALIDAGRAAPDRIASARRVKAVLDTAPITGTGATWRLNVEKALSTAGVIDGERVKNTENLVAELASAALDAIKTSGLGTGQGFTDKDRAFLEKARAGNIEINAETLRNLADLNEKAGLASISKANAVINRLRKAPGMGSVGPDLGDISAPGATDVDALAKKYLSK